jgi:O-antigen/teichoic acid export membrane protein
MGLVLAAQWMPALYRACLLGLQRPVWVGAATGLAALVRGGLSIAVLAMISPTIEAFLWAQVAAGAIESLLLRHLLTVRLPAAHQAPRASLSVLETIRPFAFGVATTMTLATVLTQVDKLLVARFVPLEQFGWFMLAVTLGSALGALILPVHNLAYPRFSELVATANDAGLAEQYHHFSQLIAVGIFPPAFLLIVFAEPFLLAWTGNTSAATAAAPVLAVWVLGTTLNSLMYVPYAAQLAHGWTRLAGTMNVAAVICMVPALVFLVPRYGAVAAGWVWVGINACYITIGTSLMHRRILPGHLGTWYLRDVLRPMLACAATAAALAVVYRHLQPASRAGEAGFLACALLVLAVAAASASPLARAVFFAGIRRDALRP